MHPERIATRPQRGAATRMYTLLMTEEGNESLCHSIQADDSDRNLLRARLELLLDMSQALAAFHDQRTLLQRVVDGAVKLLGHASAAAYLIEGDRVRLEATSPELPPEFPYSLRVAPLAEHPHIQRAIATLSPVVITDTAREELTPAERLVCQHRSLRSLLYLPLAHGGWRIGVLIVGTTDDIHVFSDDEVLTFTALATQASLKLEEARHFRKQVRDVAELKKAISERERAEAALRESETRFRRLAENARDLIYRYEFIPRRGFTYVSPAALPLTGYSPEEHYEDPDLGLKIVHPDDRPLLEAVLNGDYDRDQPLVLRWIRKDGSVLWTEQRNVPIFDETGRLAAIEGIARDITAMKAAEQALRESEAKYRLLADTTRDVIILHDIQGRITYVNRAGLEYAGCDEASVLGQPLLSFLAPEYQQSVDARMRERVGGDTSTFRYEAGIVDSAGRRVIFDVSSTPVIQDGAITQVLVVARDVTENRAIEAQLRQAQKMEAIGRLAGGVAHDFNNMLSVILGYGESLLEALPATHPWREDVLQIVEAARRSAQLTQQLLAFSRKQTLHPEALDLNAIVRGTEKMLRRVIGEDIVLTLDLAEGPLIVHADRSQMEQVILNLAINARDAMPQGGRLAIETRLKDVDRQQARRQPAELKPGRYAQLTVTDTGIGIDEDDLLHIFEPFFTTKGQGTGLGLATVYGIVTQSGGAVWASSQPGAGTTFTVCLPVLERTSPARADANRGESRRPGQGEHILVVEDESSLRGLLTHMLTTLGFRPTVVEGGAEALHLLEDPDFEPRALLTDVVMPGMNGLELANRARAARPGLKVVLMSGYATETIERHGLLDDETPLLQKPITLASLAETLRSALIEPTA